MQALMRDLRYGFRGVTKRLDLMIVASLTLSLGIGLCTTMFGIIYGAILADPPYPNGAQIVAVQRTHRDRAGNASPITLHEFVDYRAQQRSFSGLAAYTSATTYLSGSTRADRVEGSSVSANMFDVLQVKPIHGRTFRAGEDARSAPPVTVISYELWQRQFGGSSNVVGQTLRVDGRVRTIVGIMPEKFVLGQQAQLWIPLVIDPGATLRTKSPTVFALGRLRPDVSVASASADLATISKRMAADFPEANDGWTGQATKFSDAFVPEAGKRLLTSMLGAVFLVLVVACANVANLLLGHAVTQERDIGVRLAHGASRVAIARQYIAGSLLLSAIGVVGGVALAYAGIHAFAWAVIDTGVPFWVEFRLQPAVLAFTAAIALLTTLLAGALPAFQSSRAEINDALKNGVRSTQGFRIGRISYALLMIEVAVTFALLVPAGLMMRSVINVNTIEPGYVTSNVFTARVGFPSFNIDTVAQRVFFDELLNRLTALSSVKTVALASGLPATRSGFGDVRFGVEHKAYNKPAERPRATIAAVSAQYFDVIGTPVLRGRAFTNTDLANSLPVVVISQSMATKFFAAADPIGSRIQVFEGSGKDRWVTIVGVVGDMFAGNQNEPYPSRLFVPWNQSPSAEASIVARVAGEPMAITSAVHDIANELDANVPVYWEQSFESATSRILWFVKIFSTLFVIFGATALFISSVGLYAVMSFSVTQRSRELGIRMALGANSRHILTMIFRRGMIGVTIGMTFGFALALAGSRLLSFVLFQVQPNDAAVFGGVALLLFAVALFACWNPSRRATSVSPMVALRRE